MDSVPTILYNGIKGYWKKNYYERLNGAAGRKRKIRVVKLTSADGSTSTRRRRRRFWRIKLTPNLKLKLRFSPKKLLRQLRDAYVNMMLRIANTPGIGGAGGFPGAGGVTGFQRGAMKEYDERMIAEIYKSVLTARVSVGAP